MWRGHGDRSARGASAIHSVGEMERGVLIINVVACCFYRDSIFVAFLFEQDGAYSCNNHLAYAGRRLNLPHSFQVKLAERDQDGEYKKAMESKKQFISR